MKAGWEVRPLGDLIVIKPPKQEAKAKLSLDTEVSFVPMEDLKQLQRIFTPKQQRTLSEVYNGYTFFAEKDVLLAKITPCFENGKLSIASGLTNGIGFGSSEFMVLRCDRHLVPEYLFYFLSRSEFREIGRSRMTGAVGHKRVPPEFVQTQPIPLPQLDEQQRIVAVLDEAFEGLARARSHAEANLQNARELFEASLSDALNKSAADWEVLPVGDAFATSTGSTPPKSQKELYGNAVSFVKPPELLNQEIGETADGLSKKGGQVARMAPAGSVLVSCIGNLGKVGLAVTDVAFNQQINSIQPNRSKALPEFMFYQACSLSFRRQLEALAGGTTVSIVNKSRFNSIKIALPPLDVQRDLVSRFQQVDQETKELQEAYRCKLQDIDNLRQSLLQKAFAGELT